MDEHDKAIVPDRDARAAQGAALMVTDKTVPVETPFWPIYCLTFLLLSALPVLLLAVSVNALTPVLLLTLSDSLELPSPGFARAWLLLSAIFALLLTCLVFFLRSISRRDDSFVSRCP